MRSKYFLLSVPAILSWCIISNWWILDINGIGTTRDFIDLAWFYSYVDCAKTVADLIFPKSTGCFTGFNAGPITTILIWFMTRSGLTVYMAGTLIMVIVAGILLVLSIKLGRNTFPARIYQLLLILCPGMILLFERGNIDGIIFIGLTFIIFTLYTKHPFIALFLLMILSLMKFYTIFAVLILIFTKHWSLKNKIILSILYIFPVLIFAVSIIERIPYNWFLSFGSFLPLAYLDFGLREFNLEPQIIKIIFAHIGARFFLGGIISLFIFYMFYNFSKNYKALIKEIFEISRKSPIRSIKDFYFLTTSTVFICCYFFSTNYDYRLVFLVPTLILLDKKVSGTISKNWLLILLSVTTVWLGSLYSGPRYLLQATQFLGDLSANLIVGVLIAFILGCPNIQIVTSLKRIKIIR